MLIDGSTADTSVRTDSEVSSPSRLRSTLLGLAGLVILMFGLSQWQRGEPAPPRADEEAADGEENEGEEDESSATANEPQRVGPGSGPVLGEETGLALVISDPANGELRLLDLDGGAEYELAATGRVMGIIDDQLVVQNDGTVTMVPLDSSTGTGTPLVPAARGSVEVVGVADEAVWIVQSNAVTGPIGYDYAVDAYDASGNLVDKQTLDGTSLLLGPQVWGELTQEPGGGIYRRTGNSSRQLSTGRLEAVGDELALVRECDESGQRCGHNWYRIWDWVGRYQISGWVGPLQLPSPNVSQTSSLALRGNDRWLVQDDWSTDWITVIDVATGQVVRELEHTDPEFGTVSGSQFGTVSGTVSGGQFGTVSGDGRFSPDGRWLMAGDPAGLLIIDLETGAEYAYESEPTGASTSLVGMFIDRDDVGFIP